MVSKKSFKGVTQKLVGVITVNNERIEELRQILESEQNRPVTHEEAKNVGESLITVYKVLAGDREILGVARTEGKDNEYEKQSCNIGSCIE